ncbi:MAG: phosphohydrolase, partial [Patescibacteria group bacterium]
DQTDDFLDAMGYTDHGPRHINIVADRARTLAKSIGLNKQDQESAAISGYCHDMGNFLGRSQHHYWAALLFSQVFINEVEGPELATIMQAIVTHDKDEVKITNKVSAVLILADKSDVHRTRVRSKDLKNIKSDIHDRVNYSVTENKFLINADKKEIMLRLKIDTKITEPIEYFEIFIDRMTYCRLAANYLGYKFVLYINNFKLS